MYSVSNINKDEIQKLITKLLENPREGSRAEAAKALGRLEENAREAIPALIDAMKKDKSDRVRGRAALALGRIDDSSSVSALIDTLENDKSLQVRSRVAWAIGDLEEFAQDALEPLRKATKDPKNKDRLFHFAISLAKLEGVQGEAMETLQQLKEEGKLERWQIIRSNNLMKELDFRAKVQEASDNIASVKSGAKTVENEVKILIEKVQEQPESPSKQDLLNVSSLLQKMIEDQQKIIQRQEKTILDLNESLRELVKAHQQTILEPRITAEQFHEFKEKEPRERWIKRNFFALLGAIGTLISSVVALLGWLSSSLGWFG